MYGSRIHPPLFAARRNDTNEFQGEGRPTPPCAGHMHAAIHTNAPDECLMRIASRSACSACWQVNLPYTGRKACYVTSNKRSPSTRSAVLPPDRRSSFEIRATQWHPSLCLGSSAGMRMTRLVLPLFEDRDEGASGEQVRTTAVAASKAACRNTTVNRLIAGLKESIDQQQRQWLLRRRVWEAGVLGDAVTA